MNSGHRLNIKSLLSLSLLISVLATSCAAPPSAVPYYPKKGGGEGEGDSVPVTPGAYPTPGQPTPGTTPGMTPGTNPMPTPGANPTPGLPGPLTPGEVAKPDRGAAVPWQEYEAEDGKFQGKLLEPSRKVGDFAAESSGRKSVQLSAVGDYVSFKSTKAANSIVVRLAIPDSADGKGRESTLGVFVNGKRVKSLAVNSKFSWVYGDESHPTNNPGGLPRRMFDESRALLDEVIPAGAEVKLQKDAADNAEYYVIDLVDLEAVGAPATMPAGFLNVTDFGAVADDGKDDFEAFQKALKAGTAQKKGLWIPKGTFWFERRLDQRGLNIQLEADEQEVRGAGMWYSNLEGPGITFTCAGNRCKWNNFAISGGTIDRVDVNRADMGFNDGSGKDSVVDSVWVEHVKVGYWVGKHHTKAAEGLKSDGLVVKNSRFRNLFADGVNLSNGTSNSIVENNHFRNTGDDAIAIWSQLGENPNPDTNAVNNIIRYNTVQLPWRANCFAFYGGKDTQVLNNTCSDTLTYPGILFSGEFSPHWNYEGTTVIKDMTITRGGGPFYANQFHGAIKLFTVNGIKIENIKFENVDVIDSTYSGIQIEGGDEFKNITFKNVNVTGSGTAGIKIMASARSGKIIMDNVKISNSKLKAVDNETNMEGLLVTPAGGPFVPAANFNLLPNAE